MPMVEYDLDNLPKVSQEEREEIAAMTDDEIDFSEIPEITDFSGFVRWKDRNLLKKRNRVEVELDNEVLAWVGENYKARVNIILREIMNLSRKSSQK
jgi:uncharacterized protein (DUF4415 family)